MKAKYYSPRIRRDLVSRLHQEKEARGIPMTKLADRLISAALLCSDALTNDRAAIVAERAQRELGGTRKKSRYRC
jgi:hypothetical protein